MPNKKSNKSFWSVGRGGGRSNKSHDEKRYSGEHDDRMGHSVEGSKFVHSKPRVSFKKQNFKPDKFRNNFLKNIDEDVLMSGSNNNVARQLHRARGKSFPRGRNSPLPRNDHRNGRVPNLHELTGWSRIDIPYGENYTKDFVINSLNRFVAPLIFNPLMYKVEGKNAHFYVDDGDVAKKLKDSNEYFERNGHKMQVRVKTGVEPPVRLSDEIKEKIKLVLSKRFITSTMALDLSKFHLDSDLVQDHFCPLNRPSMLDHVMSIVAECTPDLQALNLDSNKLNTPTQKGFGSILKKFKNLKILYLGDNKFRDIHFLNNLKELPLEELRLEGNPLCNKYLKEEYESEVRKLFPKLLKLDGVQLPPPILFDVDDQKLKYPPTNQVFVVNEQAKEIAKQFLELYFKVFDSGNRSPLLDAYHENALYSMTSNISQGPNYKQYITESRSLNRVSDLTKRRKLLKTGKISVLSSICELPPTEHDLNSFTMDVSFVTEAMMIITVTGLYKELIGKISKDIIRFFNRTWIIVPQGTGFCIANEELHITYASTQQEKKFMSRPAAVHSPSLAGPSSTVSVENQVPLSEEAKQHMTVELSAQTNMNIEWSFKCLQEVNWSFQTAVAAFHEASRQGKIPQEAFNK
ncbi:hypothetical protein TKK_0005034 [Trichogramma kaykai]|uniref:NTF2 domain-containing protein n=1 Tax=Trichogramma kaykai TaxID=54128 RepID=A0ABD2XJ56_9HYME